MLAIAAVVSVHRLRRHQRQLRPQPHPARRLVAPASRPADHPRDQRRRRPDARGQRRRAARAAAGRRSAAGRDRHRARPQPERQRDAAAADPRPLVDRVAADVVGTAVPVAAPLASHGPRGADPSLRTRAGPGRRRGRSCSPGSWWRSTGRPGCWSSRAVVALAALGLGHDRARALGHALVEGWLVARSGSLTRRRELLATDAVIGWNLQLDLVPAPRRPGHAGRHDRGRPAVGPAARRPRARRGGGGRRRRTRPGLAVPELTRPG